MESHKIKIEWEGPLSLTETIAKKTHAGEPPDFDGEDYGLYQIYGKHILCGKDTLLYIGKITRQTFSDRFKEHRRWLNNEEGIKIFIGRIYDPTRHTKTDDWDSWGLDVDKAESVLVYKYSPNYNSSKLGDIPSLSPFRNIRLIHIGPRNRLEEQDNAPEDYL